MMNRSRYIYILGNRSMFNFHHNYKFVLFMGIGREGGREGRREREREGGGERITYYAHVVNCM